jgi:NTE family protein
MRNVRLVLSGSGTLYPAHVGAVVRLAEVGFVFEEVIGTSGGAIVASALASGYKPNGELIEMIKKTLPSKNKLVDPSVWSLMTKWGFIKGDKIEQMLDKYLVKKFKDTKIPLHVVTCNIDRREMRVFSSAKNPDMDVSLAVRASMSIPGVFVPVKLDGEMYVDGGLAGNFMIDYFGKDVPVIGIRFKSEKGRYDPVKHAFDYTSAVIDTMLEANAAERIEDVPNHKVILIKSKHGGLNLNMTEADVLDMVAEGYDAAGRWLMEHGSVYSPAAP